MSLTNLHFRTHKAGLFHSPGVKIVDRQYARQTVQHGRTQIWPVPNKGCESENLQSHVQVNLIGENKQQHVKERPDANSLPQLRQEGLCRAGEF